MISIESLWDELEKIAGGGTYRSYFTGELREDATFFPKGVMTQKSSKIYEAALNPDYAPKGPVSSINWLSYYLNRGGKNIPPKQRKEIEKARKRLSEFHKEQKKKLHGG